MFYRTIAVCLMAALSASSASAAVMYWTDWTHREVAQAPGWIVKGTITTEGAEVDVTYTNPQGAAFYQALGGVDYFTNRNRVRDAATSPFTSDLVENIPTGTDIIALRYAGMQTLTFSEAIANPVFSFVSLNGNGYGFNQDFEILSYGHPSQGKDCGYFGCGVATKQVVDLGGGNLQYRLIGTGETHGTIRFMGAFDTVTWQSLSNEYWNGFTVGIQTTQAELLEDLGSPNGPTNVPEPSVLSLLALGLAGMGAARRKKLSV